MAQPKNRFTTVGLWAVRYTSRSEGNTEGLVNVLFDESAQQFYFLRNGERLNESDIASLTAWLLIDRK